MKNNKPMEVPQPDFGLIWKHKDRVEKWRQLIIETVKKQYDTAGIVSPACCILCYDHQHKEYKEVVMVIDPRIFDAPDRKLKCYYWARNLARTIPTDPLALMFIVNGYLFDDQKEHQVVFINFETRFTSRLSVYRPEQERLVYDPELSKQKIVEEMEVFTQLFHFDLTCN